MIKISPSILACDFAHLADEVMKVEKAGAEYLHLDIMDGVFVPNISFGMGTVAAARKYSKAVFDVHLMITEPVRYIHDFKKSGADIITIHHESCRNPLDVVKQIKDIGVKAGITIRPNTRPQVLDAFIDYVDLILIMNVEPGFGGQSFIPHTLDSVLYAANLIRKSGRDIDLEVDGGISLANVEEVAAAGANVIVAGNAIFTAADTDLIVKQFRENAELGYALFEKS